MSSKKAFLWSSTCRVQKKDGEAVPIRLEAIASRLEAIIPIRLDAIAIRLDAIAIRLEAIAFSDWSVTSTEP